MACCWARSATTQASSPCLPQLAPRSPGRADAEPARLSSGRVEDDLLEWSRPMPARGPPSSPPFYCKAALSLGEETDEAAALHFHRPPIFDDAADCAFSTPASASVVGGFSLPLSRGGSVVAATNFPARLTRKTSTPSGGGPTSPSSARGPSRLLKKRGRAPSPLSSGHSVEIPAPTPVGVPARIRAGWLRAGVLC